MSNQNNISRAYLYSAVAPSDAQMAGFKEFLSKKYEHDIDVKWVQSKEFPGGFFPILQSIPTM